MSKQPSTGPQQEPFAIIALCLALVLMVLPFESDILWTLHRSGELWLERVIWLVCFLAVLIPLMISWRRVRRYPARCGGRLSQIVTAFILALNIMSAFLAWRSHVF